MSQSNSVQMKAGQQRPKCSMLLLSEKALPQGMRLMRTEVENHAGGRPPGLTLTESGVLNLPPCHLALPRSEHPVLC